MRFHPAGARRSRRPAALGGEMGGPLPAQHGLPRWPGCAHRTRVCAAARKPYFSVSSRAARSAAASDRYRARAHVSQSVYYGDASINLQDAMLDSGRITSYRDQARSGVRLYGTARTGALAAVRLRRRCASDMRPPLCARVNPPAARAPDASCAAPRLCSGECRRQSALDPVGTGLSRRNGGRAPDGVWAAASRWGWRRGRGRVVRGARPAAAEHVEPFSPRRASGKRARARPRGQSRAGAWGARAQALGLPRRTVCMSVLRLTRCY